MIFCLKNIEIKETNDFKPFFFVNVYKNKTESHIRIDISLLLNVTKYYKINEYFLNNVFLIKPII